MNLTFINSGCYKVLQFLPPFSPFHLILLSFKKESFDLFIAHFQAKLYNDRCHYMSVIGNPLRKPYSILQMFGFRWSSLAPNSKISLPDSYNTPPPLIDSNHIGGIMRENLEVAWPTVESKDRERIRKVTATVPFCKSNIVLREGTNCGLSLR